MSKLERLNNLNPTSLTDFEDYIQGNFRDTENEEIPSKQTFGDTEETLPWDAFKYFPSKRKPESMKVRKWVNLSMSVIKIIVYGILFCSVLCCSFIAKSAVLFAISQLGKDKSAEYCDYYSDLNDQLTARNSISSRIIWTWYIIGMFIVPECLCIFRSIWYSIFNNKQKMPPKQSILILYFLETLHTIGLALLVFYCLPQINSVDAAAICSCISLVPVLLNLLSQYKYNSTWIMFILTLSCNILALFAQSSGVLSQSLLYYSIDDSTVPILPIALLLSSCRWWINYSSEYSYFGFIKYLAKIKMDLMNNHYLVQGCIAFWRSLSFILCAVVISICKGIQVNEFFVLAWKNTYEIDLIETRNSITTVLLRKEVNAVAPLNAFLIQAFCTFITYQLAKFAYKTHMHKFGFAFPVSLVTPITICLILTSCVMKKQDPCAFYNIIPEFLFFKEPIYNNIEDFILSWRIWCWIIWWLSHIWITIHLWPDENEILAPAEQIFYNITYDSLLIDQFFGLNKRKQGSYNIIDKEILDSISEYGVINQSLEAQTLKTFRSTFSKESKENKRNVCVTQIYACVTMWHELKEEMRELIGSILQLDKDQCAIRVTQKYYKISIEDYYEFETHVLFDDAFCCMHGCSGSCDHNENEMQVNQYVRTFVETMKESVEDLGFHSPPPVKYPTPYGGQLVWILPGKTRLTVHLKDKNKIRHRKRWSQVMYMYYLLGHRLMGKSVDVDLKEQLAQNTYILTLDGDIDFQPTALKALLDLMKKNKELGAACGRVHPVGKGVIIGFQKFEYAVGHWLQKSTENTIGSVLCSPGCFSLFRAKALMQHNVIAKYATKSTEPRHYVQYDQGEDRWLCTLMLQAGCKVEYCAAGDAYTHAPETFSEFYLQRRRWIPSTVANMFDLLSTSKETRKMNNDMSWLYIIYQWILTGSTVIGPGTIFLMMVGAFVATFQIDNWTSFWYNLIPLGSFLIVCFFFKERAQLIAAQIVTIVYGLVMMVVLVGIILEIADEGCLVPNTLLFFIIIGQFVTTGLLHPQECSCLIYGLIYYVTVPSMYMILIIFSIFNIHNVTWGTRESKAQTSNQTQNKKIESTWFNFSLENWFKYFSCTHKSSKKEEEFLKIIYNSLNEINIRLEQIESNCRITNISENKKSIVEEIIQNEENTSNKQVEPSVIEDGVFTDTDSESDVSTDVRLNEDHCNYLINPYWLQNECIKNGEVDFLSTSEEEFWKQLIEKYLKPIENNVENQKKIAEELMGMRNGYLQKFFVLNSLFVVVVFLLQLNKDTLHLPWPFAIRYNITYISDENEMHVYKEFMSLEPIGCLFILAFVLILAIQFLAMLVHRFTTFSHILANVKINIPCCDKTTHSDDLNTSKHFEDIAEGLQSAVENEIETYRRRSIRKRRTITELVEDAHSLPKMSTNFEVLFEKKLDESSPFGEDVSKAKVLNASKDDMEAPEHKHSEILIEHEKTQSEEAANNSTEYDIKLNEHYKKNTEEGKSYKYDNPAFLNDTDN